MNINKIVFFISWTASSISSAAILNPYPISEGIFEVLKVTHPRLSCPEVVKEPPLVGHDLSVNLAIATLPQCELTLRNENSGETYLALGDIDKCDFKVNDKVKLRLLKVHPTEPNFKVECKYSYNRFVIPFPDIYEVALATTGIVALNIVDIPDLPPDPVELKYRPYGDESIKYKVIAGVLILISGLFAFIKRKEIRHFLNRKAK